MRLPSPGKATAIQFLLNMDAKFECLVVCVKTGMSIQVSRLVKGHSENVKRRSMEHRCYGGGNGIWSRKF